MRPIELAQARDVGRRAADEDRATDRDAGVLRPDRRVDDLRAPPRAARSTRRRRRIVVARSHWSVEPSPAAAARLRARCPERGSTPPSSRRRCRRPRAPRRACVPARDTQKRQLRLLALGQHMDRVSREALDRGDQLVGVRSPAAAARCPRERCATRPPRRASVDLPAGARRRPPGSAPAGSCRPSSTWSPSPIRSLVSTSGSRSVRTPTRTSLGASARSRTWTLLLPMSIAAATSGDGFTGT